MTHMEKTMKKPGLVCVLFLYCGLLYAGNVCNVGISLGNVTQSYLEDGVNQDLSFSGVGLFFSSYNGDSFGFLSSGLICFLPLAMRYGTTALTTADSLMCISMDCIWGPGYTIAIGGGFNFTIGGGVHIALIGFVPSSSSANYGYSFDTVSMGIGITPSISYKLIEKISMIAGINAAYDFFGFDALDDSTRQFNNNGYAVGGFMGVSFAL